MVTFSTRVTKRLFLTVDCPTGSQLVDREGVGNEETMDPRTLSRCSLSLARIVTSTRASPIGSHSILKITCRAGVEATTRSRTDGSTTNSTLASNSATSVTNEEVTTLAPAFRRSRDSQEMTSMEVNHREALEEATEVHQLTSPEMTATRGLLIKKSLISSPTLKMSSSSRRSSRTQTVTSSLRKSLTMMETTVRALFGRCTLL